MYVPQLCNCANFHCNAISSGIVPCDAVDPDGNFIEGKMIIDDLLKNILVMPLVAMDAKLTVSSLPIVCPRNLIFSTT